MEKEDLKKEIAELAILKEKVLASLNGKHEEGNIWSELKNGKYPQYYLLRSDEKEKYPRGRYLHKNEIDIARVCVQQEYDQLMIKQIEYAEQMYRNMQALENKLEELKNIYYKMPVAKQCLIKPYILSDAEFIKKWENSKTLGNNNYPIVNGFTTERGEIVRSKSEKMIADKLYLKKIPYVYEAKVILDNKIIFPDFILLNVSIRKEYYFEHFGMMDDEQYCKKALEKIDFYKKNGIYLGDRLLASFESGTKPISMDVVEGLLNRFLM